MEWMGFIAFMLILAYSSYPDKVKRLEAKVKKMERKQGDVNNMSKLINELVNKECKIKSDSFLHLVGSTEMQCKVLDVDDEWVKVRYTDKKKNLVIKLIRIETIDEVEILDTGNDVITLEK